MKLLTEEFLDKYGDEPNHMTELGKFVFYRTYSRWLPHLKRRETFKEAIARAVEYNMMLSVKQLEDTNYDIECDMFKQEAEVLFDNIFNLRQALSGRTHWVGGADTGVADKFPLSNFNCSFIEVKKWEDIIELFYLLLVGTGVGIGCSKEDAYKLKPIRRNYELIHSVYNPVKPEARLEDTQINIMDNGYAKIYVGDSKEAWTDALRYFFQIITEEEHENIHNIKISYNSIRPKGERLKTFGGTASGYEPLKEMFEKIDMVFRDKLDSTIEPMEEIRHYNSTTDELEGIGKYYIRPIHILDICNLIGNNVVVGGVRRTAEIFLCDEDDWEVILAKYGINGINDLKKHNKIGRKLYDLDVLPSWWDDVKRDEKTSLTHRYMSNNSIMFKSKPSRDMLNLIFTILQDEGEPGFINMEEAQRRRPNAKGLNPCSEVLLDSKQVCNLTTVNVMAFVNKKDKKYILDVPGLLQAQALSVRAGMRMTCIDLELPEWNMKHHRDRLIGVSLTGWKDAMEALDFDEDEEIQLLQTLRGVAFEEKLRYANLLRIQIPLLDTTIKPEGTLSQVFGGVSNGLHVSHAPYYIRRIRINANDPLAQVAIKLGWNVLPEVGQTMENATTLVIEFPVKSPSKRTRNEQTLEEQFNTYFMFQEYYTAHNSSNTITVKDDEWQQAEDIIFDRWDEFVGVSFIKHDGGTYQLMPYEEIDEKTYNKMKSSMKEFDISVLHELEEEETEKDLDNMQECDSGVCPII